MAPRSEIEANLGEISSSSLVLISGPPMTGKYELFLKLLAVNTDRIIVVTTKNQAARIKEQFRSVAGDVPEEHIGVVDCVTGQQGMHDVEETETVEYANSPDNLTRIGVKFTDIVEVFQEHPIDGQTGVGVHSLSQLLMHSDLKKVYQFLQVLTGQIRSAGWFGAAVIDISDSDDERYETLSHHFDGMVETRENDAGSREYRVRGLGPQTTEWSTF